jgi:2-amino-4-hydroxy-6-hydroxymethyldihydropteridine diphosphokinase/dihydropteroate synthase
MMLSVTELRSSTLQSSRLVSKAFATQSARSSRNAVSTRPISPCIQCRPFYSALRPGSGRRSRYGSYFSTIKDVRFLQHSAREKHIAYVALGSNLGDRIAMIEQACKEMEAGGKIKILRTSSLWETKAMYVLDQDKFVNGACEVRNQSHRRVFGNLTYTDRDITVSN